MKHDITAATVRVTGHGGDEINAYLAQPVDAGPAPGVLVIHHMPGWDEATKLITMKFAYHGYAAICPNLHYREGPDASSDDAAAAARAAGGVPDERFLGDVDGAIRHLRALSGASGKVGCIGYCSGGRQSFLTACVLPVDAAVDCYGAFVVGTPPPGSSMQPVIDRAKDMRSPLLGLFGAEDSHPSPEDVAQIDAELTRLGKEHEFHTYENAGHGFFAVDRAMYRVEAANEGWLRIWDFFGRHLAA
jgi:carboxymethylenebutenolidase